MKRPGAAEVRRALPEGARSLFDALVAAADERGASVYLVGGPVRDLLLGRELRDVDLLMEGAPDLGAVELARAAVPPGARVVTHERFGTVSLQGPAAALDLATVRRESYAHDGALPRVEAGTLEEDLRRRDFSVNALALPVSRRARARHRGVVDADEGLRDLELGRLRVFHPRSFSDDPTRALRAARLAPRLGFTLTRGARSSLRDALRRGAFGRVSGDRLRREFARLFDDAHLGLDPARAFQLLSDWHVLGALEPGLGLEREAVVPLRRLGRTLLAAPWSAGRWRPWVPGLALWLAPFRSGLRRRTLRRLAVRGASAARIEACIRSRVERLASLGSARGRGAVDALLGGLEEEELQALFAWAPPAERRRVLRWATQDRGRATPLGGSDLLDLGLSGPALGRALQQIRCAFLDRAVKDREEALALARELARSRPRPRPRPKSLTGARR